MSVMIEVYYAKPENIGREEAISACVAEIGSSVTDRDDDAGRTGEAVCLTIEFSDWKSALEACSKLRASGEYVEGPCDYGDD